MSLELSKKIPMFLDKIKSLKNSISENGGTPKNIYLHPANVDEFIEYHKYNTCEELHSITRIFNLKVNIDYENPYDTIYITGD